MAGPKTDGGKSPTRMYGMLKKASPKPANGFMRKAKAVSVKAKSGGMSSKFKAGPPPRRGGK